MQFREPYEVTGFETLFIVVLALLLSIGLYLLFKYFDRKR